MAGAITAQHGWAYGAQTRRLLVYALDGTTALPKNPPPQFAQALAQDDFKVDAMQAEQGSYLFLKNCVTCHGGGAVSGGYAPDLRASQAAVYDEAFKEIVVGGSRRQQGMPGFKELSDADLKAMQHYLRRQARKATTAAQLGK
jgi:quinohemoprotein ethanol dehydrogenase